MANCSKCGSLLSPGDTFCDSCGTRTEEAPSASQPEARSPLPPQTPLTRGFFSSLFDVSFTSLITTRVIKVLYVLIIIVDALTALAYVIIAFRVSSTAGILVLFVIGPIMFVLYLIIWRVLLELVIAIFRIEENTQELAAAGRAVS